MQLISSRKHCLRVRLFCASSKVISADISEPWLITLASILVNSMFHHNTEGRALVQSFWKELSRNIQNRMYTCCPMKTPIMRSSDISGLAQFSNYNMANKRMSGLVAKPAANESVKGIMEL